MYSIGFSAGVKILVVLGLSLTALFFTGKKLYAEYSYRESIRIQKEIIYKCLLKTKIIENIHLCYEENISKK